MAILTSPWTPLRVFVIGLVLSAGLIWSFESDRKAVEVVEVPPPAVTAPVEAPLAPPAPPAERAQPTFTPYTVAPDIVNREAVVSALRAEYPPLLREAGIGGSANIWFFIDRDGRVTDTRIQESSGHAQLDDAALRVADVMQFTPALNRDEKVAVWVAFPITFQAR